jgi:hypothetical protein
MDTELITIEKPAPPAIVAELAPVVALARAFEVHDLDSNRQALEAVRRLRSGEKGIADHFAKAIKDAHAAHKSILGAVNALTGPIAEARGIFDRKAADYEAAERRRAEEESRRLQELARKQEEERALQDAISAEAEGDSAAAEAILAEPVAAPVVTVAPQVARVSGVSSRVVWSAEINDIVECLLAMTRREEWRAALDRLRPELESIFRPLAVAQREALNFPGVKAVSQQAKR